MTEENDKAQLFRQIGLLTTIPILLAVGPAVGYFIGHWLDGKWDTEPIFTIILIVLGFVASGKETYSLIRRASGNNT